MTGSERLHGRFFGGKPSGEMRHRIAAPRTISNLSFREHTAQEPLSVPFKCAGDAWDIGDIDSQSEDSHGSAPA